MSQKLILQLVEHHKLTTFYPVPGLGAQKRHHPGFVPVAGPRGRWGDACFDHFLVKGVKPSESEVLMGFDELSDHRPVVQRVRWAD